MKLLVIVSLYYIKQYFKTVQDITSIFFVQMKLLIDLQDKGRKQLNTAEWSGNKII